MPFEFLFLLEEESVSEWDGGDWRKNDRQEVGERRIMIQMLVFECANDVPLGFFYMSSYCFRKFSHIKGDKSSDNRTKAPS